MDLSEINKTIIDVQEQIKTHVSALVNSTIEHYHNHFPNEHFPNPEVSISNEFREDAIEKLAELGYPNNYIELYKKRGNWNSTAALTLSHDPMNMFSIILNIQSMQDDTLFHELVHVSDYYSYYESQGKRNLSFLEFLESEDYWWVYLLSEYRAFYRCGVIFSDRITYDIQNSWESSLQRQRLAIENEQLEAYYYELVKFSGIYCATLEKTAAKSEIAEMLKRGEAEGPMQRLISFLYSIKDQAFPDLKNHSQALNQILQEFFKAE